jgi:hypothetical protein
MGRLAALLLAILCVWAGVRLYREGADRAFGGVFARFGARLEAPARRETPDRAVDGFQRAWNKSETRVDRQLGAPAAAE